MSDATEGPKKNTYNRDYYLKNRDRICAQRAQRYRENPEYREQIRAATKRQREKKKKLQESITEPRPRSTRTRGPQRPQKHVIEVNGMRVEVTMVTMGYLAQALGRKKITVLFWEDRGVLPAALYRDARGTRLYTDFQFYKIVQAWHEAKQECGEHMVNRWVSKTTFPKKLQELWQKYPYGIDLRTIIGVGNG